MWRFLLAIYLLATVQFETILAASEAAVGVQTTTDSSVEIAEVATFTTLTQLNSTSTIATFQIALLEFALATNGSLNQGSSVFDYQNALLQFGLINPNKTFGYLLNMFTNLAYLTAPLFDSIFNLPLLSVPTGLLQSVTWIDNVFQLTSCGTLTVLGDAVNSVNLMLLLNPTSPVFGFQEAFTAFAQASHLNLSTATVAQLQGAVTSFAKRNNYTTLTPVVTLETGLGMFVNLTKSTTATTLVALFADVKTYLNKRNLTPDAGLDVLPNAPLATAATTKRPITSTKTTAKTTTTKTTAKTTTTKKVAAG